MYLTYAEAILQSGGSLTEAIKYVDAVRARVGMKGLVECNPDKNLTSDKDALLEEIMRERACELAFRMSRYFDLIRYKRADLFEKKLHGLRMYRMVDGERDETMWWDGDRKNTAIKEDNPASTSLPISSTKSSRLLTMLVSGGPRDSILSITSRHSLSPRSTRTMVLTGTPAGNQLTISFRLIRLYV